MAAIIQLLLRLFFIGSAAALTGLGVYTALPDSVKLAVPFTSQAPDGIWAEPWQNACEEASITMIDNFYNQDDLTKDEAREEILNIFDFKNGAFGVSLDESMSTVAAIINRSNLVWRATVVDEPTIQDMRTELAAQRPIIAPIYAPALENPYYTDGGPDYHVVVIVGYDDVAGEFIVHDPGTRRGEDFRYGYQEFHEAISDFLSDEDYESGPTRVIFTAPKS